MYVPGTDTIVRTFRVTPKDVASIRRGWRTAKAVVGGTVAGAVSDPSFGSYLDEPRRGPIVALVATAALAAAGKRRREEMREALETPPPGGEDSRS